MRLIHIVLAAILLLPVAREAQGKITCSAPEYTTCTDHTTATVGGIRLKQYCAREAGTRDCVDSAPLNQCQGVAPSKKCTRTSRKCVDYRNGACRQWRLTFDCLNEDRDMSPAVLTKTVFGPVQEEIVNRCGSLEARTDECELERTENVKGAGVRTINRKDFSRSWWVRKRTYSCLAGGEGDNTCGSLESDPTCKLQGDTCLVTRDGVCTNREYHYLCGIETGKLETSCEPVNVCVGDTCMGVEQEASEDFGTSAAWLNVLAEMQSDFRAQASQDPNDIRFFQGEVMNCSKMPGRNCCSNRGVFTNLKACPESASVLADIQKAGASHYLGVKCDLRVFGACLRKRYYYCTYKSKFGRVFIEEFKKQIAQSWGWPNGADCGELSVEDFGNIDIDAMDLSPVFGDVMESISVPVSDQLQDFYEDRFPSAPKDARDTFGELGE